MNTAVVSSALNTAVLLGRRYDRLFFTSISILILVCVAIGFAPSYYLAGVFRAHLPSTIVHIHGAVFSAWILLLIVQTSLVAAHRVPLHRTLGLAGFALALLVFLCGWLAMASELHFRASEPHTVMFGAVSFNAALAFAIPAAFAFITRKKNLAAHKRLILIATIGLIPAAFFRWHLPWMQANVGHDYLTSDVFLLAILLYDFWSTRKVHRATLLGSVCVVFLQQTSLPLGSTEIWQEFAHWIQSLNI